VEEGKLEYDMPQVITLRDMTQEEFEEYQKHVGIELINIILENWSPNKIDRKSDGR
jgi:hypothetical protein